MTSIKKSLMDYVEFKNSYSMNLGDNVLFANGKGIYRVTFEHGGRR